jgi:hypothetical protein
MKSSILLTAAMLMFLTAAQTARADEGRISQKAGAEESYGLSDLPMRLNPQIGVSSFQYSGEGSSKAQLSGGALVEFGEGAYRVETGALVLRSVSTTTYIGATQDTLIQRNLLAIPVDAKFRLYSDPAQAWFLKAGFTQAYELSSNKGDITNKIDVLASLGITTRLAFTKRADFLIESSYNRGLVPALKTAHTDAYNEGLLILAGISFRL